MDMLPPSIRLLPNRAAQTFRLARSSTDRPIDATAQVVPSLVKQVPISIRPLTKRPWRGLARYRPALFSMPARCPDGLNRASIAMVRPWETSTPQLPRRASRSR
jgi:hypothetical protein